jgi:hypothetical protein
LRFKKKETVHFEQIKEKVTSNEDISENNLQRYLELMCNEGILQLGSSQNGGSYAIRFNDIVLNLKRQNAENIVEQKYGGIPLVLNLKKSYWGKNL